MTLADEVTRLLQELIRLDTVNPPGNETRAAELLGDYLAENGVESELYAKTPERANLVARIPGRGDGPSGRSIRGRASFATARSGAAARST